MKMVLQKFNKTGPDIFILIIIIASAIWLISFLNPAPVAVPDESVINMPLYAVLENLTGNNARTGIIISFLTVLLISYLMVDFNTSDMFIGQRTFMPALFYILITSLLPDLRILNPVLVSAPFLVLALKHIMNAYKTQGTAYTFFDAALFIGTGSLFYAGLLWYGILLFAGMAKLHKGNFKEIIISLAGLAAPWFITLSILYLSDSNLDALSGGIVYSLFRDTAIYEFKLYETLASGAVLLILFISIAYLVRHMNTQKIRARNTFVLLFWIFFLSIALCLICRSVSAGLIWIAAIPSGYFLSYFFAHAGKSVLPKMIFMFLLILTVVVQLAGIFA